MSEYLNFRDRFDGGGAGKSGDKFEGGGLFSFLANMLATPAGSQQQGQPEQLPAMMPGMQAPMARPSTMSAPPMGQPAPQAAPIPQTPYERPSGLYEALQGAGAQGMMDLPTLMMLERGRKRNRGGPEMAPFAQGAGMGGTQGPFGPGGLYGPQQ